MIERLNMKKLLLLLVLTSLSIQSQNIKILTYNLRVDFGGDGENNWEFRRDLLANQIAFYNPDFIGTQEGKWHQLHYIDSLLTNHIYIGTSRDNSKTEGEFCAIFYNKNKYKCLSESTFWLSPTPEIRSRGWDAAYDRICTYALFEDLKTRKQFYVFNTHLDHIGEVAKAKGAELIVERIKLVNLKNLPVILMGDFNSEPNSVAYQTISKFMNDSKLISQSKPFGPSGTFNTFKFHEPVTYLIDYIFTTKGNIDVLKHAVSSDSKDCKYPSDHLPVYIEMAFKK